MNTSLFEQAKQSYDNRDYRTALSLFTACLKDANYPLQFGETGLIYHQIGNCLVKMNNCNEAIVSYSQAVADSGYDATGSVHYNLGMAYASLKDYEDAINHFQAAVSDGKYDTPYKAYFAMGNALMKLGKSAEAGVAFRQAALDEKNPDPTKSLLNLGVCFMALDRPSDAVISYESALQFDMQPAVKNKLYANLGQAYVSNGQMEKACGAFEEALADKTYFLSDSASVDYQRAIAAVAQGTTEVPMLGYDQYGDELYDEYNGGYQMPYDEYGYGDAAMGYAAGAYMSSQLYDEYGNPIGYYDEQGNWHDEPLGEERFFNASDAEIEQFASTNEKADRKRRNVGLKILIAIIIVLVLLIGAGIGAYVMGYGYPMQETVATQLFANPDNSEKLFANDLDASKKKSLINMIPEGATANVVGLEKSMSESSVYLEVTTKQGGTIYYKLTMVRDLIGWKISNIELYFNSQN